MLGGAVGDALGAQLEGLNRSEIKAAYGKVSNYVKNPSRKNLEPGQWTDDTALTLATMQSLVINKTLDLSDIKDRMGEAYKMEPFRGYGPNTRKVLEGGQPSKKSKGNGAAMRIAPVALFYHNDFDALRENVEKASQITHVAADAIDGAQAVAFAVAKAVRGELKPGDLIDETVNYLGLNTEMSYKLREVKDLIADQSMRTEEALDHIGTRGLALESVGCAFYAFLKTPNNFYESIIQAINAGGDTDTIGCITGYLSGTYNGEEKIERKWLNRLEGRSDIRCWSGDLFDLIRLRLSWC